MTISTTHASAAVHAKAVGTPATLHVLVAPVPVTGYNVPLVAESIDTHKQSSILLLTQHAFSNNLSSASELVAGYDPTGHE